MNQIADVDGFSLMNNLRLVVIVAIFIILIIALFYNRILGFLERVKGKDMQAVNPSDDSSREEQPAPGAVDDFFGMEKSTEKEVSKGGESTAESEVVIEGQPAVNYEKIETDLKAVGDEVTTKIEGLISKVEAVGKEILNKIEGVIDAKIQEASNKINDRISEAIRTQINSINPVSEEPVDSLRKDEVSKEINEKEQADTIVPSGGIEKKERDLKALVKDRDILEKLHLFVRYHLDAFEILPFDESKTVSDEKKERDLAVPSEVKINVKIDEKKSVKAITSTGKIEEKISKGGVGKSVGPARIFFQRLLSIGIPSTEEPKELVEGKVEFEEKKKSDLEASVEDSAVLGKLAGSLQMNEDPFDVLPSEDTVVPEEIKEEEQADTIAPSGGIEEKISEGDVGESVDFDIEKLLEEEPVGMPSTEEPKESVEEKVEFTEEKEEDLELPAEEAVAHEGIDEKEIDTIIPQADIKEKAIEAAKGEEAEEKKQPTGETADFDIQDFLEKLGIPPSGKE